MVMFNFFSFGLQIFFMNNFGPKSHNCVINDTQREKTQKRLTTRIFKNQILANPDYIIVYTIN